MRLVSVSNMERYQNKFFVLQRTTNTRKIKRYPIFQMLFTNNVSGFGLQNTQKQVM